MNISHEQESHSLAASLKLPLAFAILGTVLTLSPSLSANESLFLDRVVADEDILVTSDIWYGSGNPDESQPLYLDTYQPISPHLPSILPAFIYVHGGAFSQGDKADQPAPLYCFEFARRGYVVFSINYTLDGTVGSASLDAAEAVRWVKANTGAYFVDPDRILIGGHSAGAATSLNVGVLEAGNLGGPGAEVAAVLNAAGGSFVDLDEVDAGDPPIFIINGTEDMLAPVESARHLADRLDSLSSAHEGIVYPYSYMEVEGAGHSFIPGTGTGMSLPRLVASPQDEFQGWSNTEINGKTVEAHVFEFFFEQLNLAQLATGGATWAGYEVVENGWTDTGSWMGWLNVSGDPWIWSESLNTWLYMPEQSGLEFGAWVFLPGFP